MFDLSIISPIGVLEVLGTFAFAISGIRLAAQKKMIDWFGAFVIGLVTATGGGTTRDLLLGVRPFWLEDPTYLATTGVALVVALLFQDRLFRRDRTMFLFDAIGLGLFTIAGLTKSLALGLPVWTSILMGTITGSVGGVIRDVLINEVPLLFRKDIYALACVLGGVVYVIVGSLSVSEPIVQGIAVAVVILTRFVAVRYHLQLPTLILRDGDGPSDDAGSRPA